MLYEFVLFDRPSVSLKWMGVIFLCCRSVTPCHTLCHSELLVDCHCLKFHGRFFICSFFPNLLVRASTVFPLSYTICLVPVQSFLTNHPIFLSAMGKLQRLSTKRAVRKARKSAAAPAAAAADAIAATGTAVAPPTPAGAKKKTSKAAAAAAADATTATAAAIAAADTAVASPVLAGAKTKTSKAAAAAAADVFRACRR